MRIVFVMLLILLFSGCSQDKPAPTESPNPVEKTATPETSSSPQASSTPATPETSSSPQASATPGATPAVSPSPTVHDHSAFLDFPELTVVIGEAYDITRSKALTARKGDRVVRLVMIKPEGFYVNLLVMSPAHENPIQLANLNPGRDEAKSLKTGEPFLGQPGTHTEPFELVMTAFLEGEFEGFAPSEKERAIAESFFKRVQSLEF